MHIKKVAITSALALAAGIAAAPIGTAYSVAPLPTLLMLRFYIIPTTESCYEGACQSPANDHTDELETAAVVREAGS